MFWAGMNKGERSLAVDMSTPRGQEIVTRVICAPGPHLSEGHAGQRNATKADPSATRMP